MPNVPVLLQQGFTPLAVAGGGAGDVGGVSQRELRVKS